jgi:hypothetical protein
MHGRFLVEEILLLAMSSSVASELGSIESCTSTRIPLQTHSLLSASDSTSALKVDSSIGSAVVIVVVGLFCILQEQKQLEQQVLDYVVCLVRSKFVIGTKYLTERMCDVFGILRKAFTSKKGLGGMCAWGCALIFSRE